MVVVKKKKGENTDTLMRRFNRISKEENIIWDVNKKRYFLRASLMKKEKSKEKQKRKAQQRRRLYQ